MVVQSITGPDGVCKERELYFRIRRSGDGGEVPEEKASGNGGGRRKHGTETAVFREDGSLWLAQGAVVTTDCYMNLFDARTWYRYTGRDCWELALLVSGRGITQVIAEDDAGIRRHILCQETFDFPQKRELLLRFRERESPLVYLRLEAAAAVTVDGMAYRTCEEMETWDGEEN